MAQLLKMSNCNKPSCTTGNWAGTLLEGLVSLFNGISTTMGYLMSKPSL